MRHCPFCAEQIQEAARICRFCGREIAPLKVTRRDHAEDGLTRFVEVGLGLIVFASVAYLVLTQVAWFPQSPAVVAADTVVVAVEEPPAPPPPLVIPLLDSLFVLRAGEHADTIVAVDDERPCILSGRVVGLEGGNRDVEVYVLDEDGYTNWHNGIAPLPMYASGRT